MKILNGSELAGYIKERQAAQVRSLRQGSHVIPRLAIVQTTEDPVIASYVKLKQRYADDIQAEVDHHMVAQSEAKAVIAKLNEDETVHGIIVQLPLADPYETETLVNLVDGGKDVDGLGEAATFDPATPLAINWLLAGYNINLPGKRLLIVGAGKLVGTPLARMWRDSGLSPAVVDIETSEAEFLHAVKNAEVIISAAGAPGILTSSMIAPETVVVDAGVATESGKLHGDLAADVRSRTDLILTPEKGGVGPLTVTALFENVLIAARCAAASSDRQREPRVYREYL